MFTDAIQHTFLVELKCSLGKYQLYSNLSEIVCNIGILIILLDFELNLIKRI